MTKPSQADRDARVERMLGELDGVEARMEELRPANRVRTMLFVAAFLSVLIVPGISDYLPFVIVAVAYASFGLTRISATAEELSELKCERARLTEGPTG
jgi:hypothetical protein